MTRDSVPAFRNAGLPALLFFLIFLIAANSAYSSSLRISSNSRTTRNDAVEADYTMSHVFIDEAANESVPFTVFFDPQTLGVASAEVYTNLNRRNRASLDADGDGVDDGIRPPDGNKIPAGDDRNYFKAYSMKPVAGGYVLTLNATQCGAYRLTARYRLTSDPPGVYHWYGNETNGSQIPKRDYAIVVSPAKARSLQLYETDVLAMDATGTASDQRGTFQDLVNGPSPGSAPQFSLKYLKTLGVNTIWLLPVHPAGIDGRQVDPETHQPYNVGSPYAVKNFFSIMPLLAKSFIPGSTPASNDTPAGREQAQTDFVNFVHAADQQGIDIMLDAPFNHTAHDVELAPAGQVSWGNTESSPTSEIRNVEARFFSLSGEYDRRANSAADVALAPDRFDFGKWNDTYDIYFGRYAALVANGSERNNYTNEGDWFDYSVGNENSTGSGSGHFDTVTQRVWRYFGDYLDFWLTQTGYPPNPQKAALNSSAGIDALRGDFGQGLPPQCWEYLINRTRARKWNFVFMAESLDGGAVTYRSARHFDVLNESLIYDLHHVMNTSDLRRVYDQRRASYGNALILLNTSSHDEDTYKDPFQSFLRFAVNNAMVGVPLISAGQELGLRGTVVPPNDSDAAQGPPFGFEKYFAPFDPNKKIPQFMTFNSMMPLWQNLAEKRDNSDKLQTLYSDVAQARRASKALRSPNLFYLNLQDNTPHGEIFSVAKFEKLNGDPSQFDVVFAFISLQPSTALQTPAGNSFNLNIDQDRNGANDFGIRPDHLYNVKNIAAYSGRDLHRQDVMLWSTPRRGSDLLRNGLAVLLNNIPVNDSDWETRPYEAQYLKLVDVTTAPH